MKGDETVETWAKAHVYDEQEEGENMDVNDDEFYQNSSDKKSHLSLALLDVEDDYTTTSFSSGERSNSPHTLQDYLTGRCRRTFSFH